MHTLDGDFFVCKNCDTHVPLAAPGTKNRNHCPFCLHSVHIDLEPGDRKNACMGVMPPIGKFYKPDGEEMLVHQCIKCKFIRKNRVAGDDSFELLEKLQVIGDPASTNLA